MPGWQDDDHAAALICLLRHRLPPAPSSRSPRSADTAALGISQQALNAVLGKAPDISEVKGSSARVFFETFFEPCQIVLPENAPGFVTGYFEPVLQASPVETERFSHPLYALPEELADISASDMARQPYFTRSQIRQGALAGRGLELAWLESPIDQYFVHIQGSVRLQFPDRATCRLSFAGKNGYPYTSIGARLIDAGEIPQELMSMTTLKQWLMENPAKRDAVMDRNQSYVFFQPYVGGETDDSPVGASGVPLFAGRSIAIDPQFHIYGTPIFVSVDQPFAQKAAPFGHLMIAQDTGSAIVGPARGDLFIGTGDEAGAIAGRIRHDATFHVLRSVGVEV